MAVYRGATSQQPVLCTYSFEDLHCARPVALPAPFIPSAHIQNELHCVRMIAGQTHPRYTYFTTGQLTRLLPDRMTRNQHRAADVGLQLPRWFSDCRA